VLETLRRSWLEFVRLVRAEPLVLEAITVVVLFALALWLFRKVRKAAAELERRKALSEYVRGLDEFLRGNHNEARGILEHVLERDPENVEARIALGDCYRETGDPAEAKKHHHHVHRVFGNELARNFVSLGRDELALQNPEQAVEAFRQARKLAPHSPEPLEGLARAYGAAGDPVEAARMLRLRWPDGPTGDLPPRRRRDAAASFTDAGFALLADGDAEGSMRMFTEALAFQAEHVRARMGILRAAHALGDEERAREIVRDHVDELRRLADDEELLFEPPSAGRATVAVARGATREATSEAPETAEGVESATRAGAGSSPFLPAPAEEVRGLVQAVERRTARYRCESCGALARTWSETCARCGLIGTLEAIEELAELYTLPLAGFEQKIDEVEESPAFVQRLAQQAALGDEEAMQRLIQRGPAALYDVFVILPRLEGRVGLGARLAAIGPAAAREVQRCQAARAAIADAEFAAAFYCALGQDDARAFVPSLGTQSDAALAAVLADPRSGEATRDVAAALLGERGPGALPALVDALAQRSDAAAVQRAAGLLREWGGAGIESIERRYFQTSVLRRLLGARGARRRAVADLLAASGMPAGIDLLERVASAEKDRALRAHYSAALDRARREGES